jgi:hypothetical protein
MSVEIKRLEQALRRWEDLVFLRTILTRFNQKYNIRTPQSQRGDIPNVLPWQDLRGDLLKCNTADIIAKYASAEWIRYTLGSLADLPEELCDWTQNSRRVFYLTRELQTLLAFTSFDKITWGDVPWPFRSFVIVLEDSIVNDTFESTARNMDTILVSRSREPEGDLLKFRMIADTLDKTPPLSWFEKDQLEQLFRKNRKGFSRNFNAKTDRMLSSNRFNFVTVLSEKGLRNEYVLESQVDSFDMSGGGQERGTQPVDKEKEAQLQPIAEAAVRVVVGLCFYLASLPVESVHRSDWIPALSSNQKAGKLAISSGAEICTVSSIHTLSAEEREVMAIGKRSFSEMSAHWRRGHWRRKPGEGENPNALKVVWVRPTLVRRDRLQPGEIPVGTLTVV